MTRAIQNTKLNQKSNLRKGKGEPDSRFLNCRINHKNRHLFDTGLVKKENINRHKKTVVIDDTASLEEKKNN